VACRTDEVVIELGSGFGYYLEMPDLEMHRLIWAFDFELCKSRSTLKSVTNLSTIPASTYFSVD
jgi:hypothetical protein